jgi:metal-responsive CopG/Arc/MetJ family transcriptional regulator
MSDLTNRVRFSSTIDKELAEKLKALSEKTMINQSKLIDKAVILLLKEFEDKNRG